MRAMNYKKLKICTICVKINQFNVLSLTQRKAIHLAPYLLKYRYTEKECKLNKRCSQNHRNTHSNKITSLDTFSYI